MENNQTVGAAPFCTSETTSGEVQKTKEKFNLIVDELENSDKECDVMIPKLVKRPKTDTGFLMKKMGANKNGIKESFSMNDMLNNQLVIQ